MYQSNHRESTGKGRAYEWNYSKMDSIYEAYKEYRETEVWD